MITGGAMSENIRGERQIPGAEPACTTFSEILRITAACDQRCVFCNAREDIGHPDGASLMAAVADLAGRGVRRLVISGGEPTLSGALLPLVRHARALGVLEVELQTNAVACARPGAARELHQAGVTSAFVALHAHEAELSDSLTGAPGTFDKTVAGTRALMEAGIPVTLNIVVQRRNYRHLMDYVRFVATALPGFQALSFSFVMSGGAAMRNRWVVPRLSAVAPYLRRAYELCRELGIPFSNPGCGVPVCFVPGFEWASDEYRQLSGLDPKTLAELKNNETEKVKVAACAACRHEPHCLGVWRGYIAIHGEDEVRPAGAGGDEVSAEILPGATETAGTGGAVAVGDEVPGNEVLRLTLACNERCPFCNVPPESDPEFTVPTTEEAKAMVARFAARGGREGRELSFSGGEPLLRSDLEELVVYAREQGIERVQVQTNATLLTPARAVALRGAGLTSAFVAYHSHKPEVQDKLTGLRGSGESTLKGIKAALRAGIPVTLNPVLTTLNLASFPDFIDHLAAELGPLGTPAGKVPLEVVCVTLMQPHGRAAAHPALLPSYSDSRPAIAEAIARAARHGIDTDTHYASLPLCFLSDSEATATLEYRECRALRARPPGQARDERLRPITSGKAQGPPCVRCVHKNFCNGVWRAYVWKRGWSELKPRRRSRAFWG